MMLCGSIYALLHVISLVDWPKHVKFFFLFCIDSASRSMLVQLLIIKDNSTLLTKATMLTFNESKRPCKVPSNRPQIATPPY